MSGICSEIFIEDSSSSRILIGMESEIIKQLTTLLKLLEFISRKNYFNNKWFKN